MDILTKIQNVLFTNANSLVQPLVNIHIWHIFKYLIITFYRKFSLCCWSGGGKIIRYPKERILQDDWSRSKVLIIRTLCKSKRLSTEERPNSGADEHRHTAKHMTALLEDTEIRSMNMKSKGGQYSGKARAAHWDGRDCD